MNPPEDPLVSVVMPAYNSDDYLTNSIQSILQQAYKNFEFIIICDDPTDKAKEIIDSFQQQDPRIRVVYRKREGLVAALNTGCTLAQGKYIVRMDADDLSLPNRLGIQVAYMENHLDVGICGSAVRTFGEYETTMKFPTTDSLIKAALLFYNPYIHPTIIIRKKLLDAYCLKYDENYTFVEDYELWVRCSKLTKFAIIDAVLLRYRIHPAKVSTFFAKQQRLKACKIFLDQLKILAVPANEKQISLHLSLNSLYLSLQDPKFKHDREFLIRINNWLVELIEANRKKKVYDCDALAKISAQTWTNHCILATHVGIWSWDLFCNSKLTEYITLTKVQKVKYLIAFIIKVDSLLKIKRLLRI